MNKKTKLFSALVGLCIAGIPESGFTKDKKVTVEAGFGIMYGGLGASASYEVISGNPSGAAFIGAGISGIYKDMTQFAATAGVRGYLGSKHRFTLEAAVGVMPDPSGNNLPTSTISEGYEYRNGIVFRATGGVMAILETRDNYFLSGRKKTDVLVIPSVNIGVGYNF
ncbi:hypothetical protein HYX14_01240 [Candidatus Woesearchaeota archaeon]|nr:hypothetical protein [Candidatus Woesearchaeota archaeon]